MPNSCQKGTVRYARIKKILPSNITCHFCHYEWNPGHGCFVCPQCHTPYDPKKSPATGFGIEILAARQRSGTTKAQLSRIVDCHPETIKNIENGKTMGLRKNKRMLVVLERIRIWIESTKSPIDKRKEIDDMFKESKDVQP